MSKKRKTREQKEKAVQRREEFLQHIHTEAPTYSITNLKPTSENIKTNIKSKSIEDIAQKDVEYLKHDIISITASSGIVAAFDILLFTLLASGILHLHFLGY